MFNKQTIQLAPSHGPLGSKSAVRYKYFFNKTQRNIIIKKWYNITFQSMHIFIFYSLSLAKDNKSILINGFYQNLSQRKNKYKLTKVWRHSCAGQDDNTIVTQLVLTIRLNCLKRRLHFPKVRCTRYLCTKCSIRHDGRQVDINIKHQ